MINPKLKRAYDDFVPESDATGLKCEDKSLAVQSSVEEVDINTIVRRFGLTGQLPSDVRMPQYEDFDAIWDYKSALDMILEARTAFMRFSGEVRARFDNDPDKLMAFVADPKNLEEARKLGLAVPPVAPDALLEAVKALRPGQVEGKGVGSAVAADGAQGSPFDRPLGGSGKL